MGVIEIFVLLIYLGTNSNTLLLISVIPLALVYNLYAVPKFFEIQDYFHKGELVRFTSLMSVTRETGVYIGIITAGFLIENYSIKEVLIVDIFSFIFYGLIVFIVKNKLKKQHSENSKVNSEYDNEKKYCLPLRNFLVTSLLTGFLLAWQQSSSIPAINNSFGIDLDTASYFRAIFGVAGLLIGLLIVSKINNIEKLWSVLPVIFLPLFLVLYYISPYAVMFILFSFLGLLKSVSDAAKKSVYISYKSNNIYPGIASIQWTTESFWKIALVPLALVIDKFFQGTQHTLIIYIVLLIVLSVLSGIGNSFYIRKKYYD